MTARSYVAARAAQVHAARGEAAAAELAVHGARDRLIAAKARSAADFSAVRAAEARRDKANARLLSALEAYFAASEAARACGGPLDPVTGMTAKGEEKRA